MKCFGWVCARIFAGTIALMVVVAGESGTSRAADLGSGGVMGEPTIASAWSTAVHEFKLQLHALASEALILQLKTPTLTAPRSAKKARDIRWDAQNRLSDSLRSTNALLSMLEIADHSDQGPRVREIVFLWLDSSRTAVSEHLKNMDVLASDAPLDPATAEFLEELKILWRRLDRAYAELRTALEAAESAGRTEAVV